MADDHEEAPEQRLVHVVISCGGDGTGSLLDEAGLEIDGVYLSYEDAWRASSSGDQELHSFLVASLLNGETREVPWREVPGIPTAGYGPLPSRENAAMTDDPVARLKAGLDADEAAAKAALSQNAEEGMEWWFDGATPETPREFHVARQGPARTLRRVAADRAFLALVEHYLTEDPAVAPWDGESRDLMDAAIRARLAVYSDDDEDS